MATGARSELGALAGRLQHIEPLKTPLLQRLTVLGRRLCWLIVLLALAVGSFGVLIRQLPVDEMLLAAVGIAVAAVPEGLPPVVTILLAIGVQSLARQGATVRRLAAVETLGEVTVIFTAGVAVVMLLGGGARRRDREDEAP